MYFTANSSSWNLACAEKMIYWQTSPSFMEIALLVVRLRSVIAKLTRQTLYFDIDMHNCVQKSFTSTACPGILVVVRHFFCVFEDGKVTFVTILVFGVFLKIRIGALLSLIQHCTLICLGSWQDTWKKRISILFDPLKGSLIRILSDFQVPKSWSETVKGSMDPLSQTSFLPYLCEKDRRENEIKVELDVCVLFRGQRYKWLIVPFQLPMTLAFSHQSVECWFYFQFNFQ